MDFLIGFISIVLVSSIFTFISSGSDGSYEKTVKDTKFNREHSKNS